MLDLSSWDFNVIDEMDYLTPRDMNIKWITIWKWSLFSYRDEIFFLLCIDKQNRKHLWVKDSYNYCDMFL